MSDTQPDPKAYSLQGKAWSAEEDRHLYDAFAGGDCVDTLSSTHKRSPGGIRARLSRLGLIDENGETICPLPPFATVARHDSAAGAPRRPNAEEDTLPSVFGVRTSDGWIVEVRSNRPLDKPFADRLDAMLQAIVQPDATR